MNNEIKEKIQKIDTYFRVSDPTAPEKERVLSRMVKLTEEVGELSEAVLYENDVHQRNKEREVDFDSELADVIICTLLLANNRDKDINEVINKKLDKQLTRFNL